MRRDEILVQRKQVGEIKVSTQRCYQLQGERLISFLQINVHSQNNNYSTEKLQSVRGTYASEGNSNSSLKKNAPVPKTNKIDPRSSSFSQKTKSEISPDKQLCLSNGVNNRGGCHNTESEKGLPYDRWSPVNDFHQQNLKKLEKNKCACRCSCMCIIGSIFVIVLLSITIAATLVGVLIKANTAAPTDFSTSSTTSATLITYSPTPENTQVTINCNSTTPTLHIIYAYYGVQNSSVCNCAISHCTEMDVTQNVTSYCANNGNSSYCSFFVANSFFSDTCQGLAKTFWLTYFCS